MAKRISLLIAVLMVAVPAFATVNFDAVQADANLKVVSITYSGASDPQIRAFALNITVDSGTIVAISGFKSGESNDVSKGYGIFPGRFRDYINPATPNWGDGNYTPVAPSGDLDALGGIGTAGITIELGSLYVDGNAPAKSGTLCKLTISSACTMTIAVNTVRGKVVNEDASEALTNLPVVKVLPVGCTVPDIDNGDKTAAQADADILAADLITGTVSYDWSPTVAAGNVMAQSPAAGGTVACGSAVNYTVSNGPTLAPPLLYGTYDSDCNIPVYWGPSAGATSYDVERNLNGAGFANAYSGTAMYMMNSTNSVVGTVQYRARANGPGGLSGWTTGGTCTVILSTCYKTSADPNYAGWVAMGRPDCWCSPTTTPKGSGYQCDGDGDGTKSSGGYRVYSGDSTIMSKNWKKRSSTGTLIAMNVAADPNTTTLSNGMKIHGACADFDHKQSSGGYRIYSADSTILTTNWKKKDSTATSNALPGNCPR